MRIHLAYGADGLELDLPDELRPVVIEPRHRPALAEAEAAVRSALRAPIGSPALSALAQAGRGRPIGVVFSDATRPLPRRLLLEAVLEELAGVPREDIILFNALGTHRPSPPEELVEMLGPEIAAGYRIVQNDSFNPSTQVSLGCSSFGHEVRLNAGLAKCGLLVLVGFIEPHLFAGFSGGPKSIMPGMAGQATVLGNHDAGMIAHSAAAWGRIDGNPIWEEAREVLRRLLDWEGGRRAFLLNVTLDAAKEITGVFAGAWEDAHRRGCAFVRETAMVPTDGLFDVVVTTNSGRPLDLNVYQAVKGMSAAARIVKDGGAIVCVSECREGVPGGSAFESILAGGGNPEEVLRSILTAPGPVQDQWQAQIQTQIQRRAEIHLYADGLDDASIRRIHLIPCRDVAGTIRRLAAARGPAARIAVLPQGPQTVPEPSSR
jgi:nickel-dependent lactate racemase